MQPVVLDGEARFSYGYYGFEIEAASFSPNGIIALATSDPLDTLDDDYEEFSSGIGPRELVRYSPSERRILSRVRVQEQVGTLMPVGPDADFVLAFYGHPKLFDARTGQVVGRWPEIETGKQAGSIIHGITPPPPLALDPGGCRFAVAGSDGVTAIQLG